MIHKFATANHDEWLSLRHKYIGGSDSAAIVGLNQYSSPYSVWAEKTGEISGFSGNLATEVGTFLEEFVAQKFAEVSGKKVRKCNLSMVNDLYPWAIANVDRLIVGEDAGLEIKTTSEMNLKKFKGGEYPANYYVQSMHYMAVTGRKRWYLAVLIGNRDFQWYTIERDEDEIKALMEAEQRFWECVQNNTPPAVDGMQATSDTIAQLHPEGGTAVDLTPVCDYLRQYIELKAQMKELEKKVNTAANHIKEFMAEAGTGTYQDIKVSWKEQTRNTFDKTAFSKEHPEIDLSDFMKQSVSRPFKI